MNISMTNKKSFAFLKECLRDRDLAPNNLELLEDPRSEDAIQLDSWIRETLCHETLLSNEELSLYSLLKSSGEADVSSSTEGPCLERTIEDAAIQHAIEELKRSTSAIEKHSEVLKIQQDVVASLVANSTKQSDARVSANTLQYQLWATEHRQIGNEVEELNRTLSDQIAELELQIKNADSKVIHHSSDILRTDDRFFLSLKKLIGELNSIQPVDDNISQKIRDLCARLIKYTVECVRTRLDRVYLETLVGASGTTNHRRGHVAEVMALKDELESLYSEILPVAQMSVEQRYLESALKFINAQDLNGDQKSSKAIDYILSCLDFLGSRLRDFSVLAAEYQSHRTAMQFAINTIRAELETTNVLSPSKLIQPRSPLRRKNSKPISPIRSRMGTRRRSSTSSLDESIAPEQLLLRNLGIILQEEPSSELNISQSLHESLADRAGKLRWHEQNLQLSSESTISGHLHDAIVTLNLLRDSLLSETPYQKVNFLDPMVRTATSELEHDTEELRDCLEAMNLEKLQQRNTTRETLIERWASR